MASPSLNILQLIKTITILVASTLTFGNQHMSYTAIIIWLPCSYACRKVSQCKPTFIVLNLVNNTLYTFTPQDIASQLAIAARDQECIMHAVGNGATNKCCKLPLRFLPIKKWLQLLEKQLLIDHTDYTCSIPTVAIWRQL